MTKPASDERWGTLRILDANANRAQEGLRVVEEYFRFVVQDTFLTDRCKRLRHQLHAVLQQIPATERQRSRDSRQDVGRTVKPPSESRRDGHADVVAASFKRVQQAMRCLEEYSKAELAELASACESLRYETYDLEKLWGQRHAACRVLDGVQLYVLIDGGMDERSFEGLTQSLVAAQVPLIQLRTKQQDDRYLLRRAASLREILQGTTTRWIMNDRPDLAVLAGADGVHLGQDDLPVAAARRVVGPSMLIGASTHCLNQAEQAVADGADYLGVGPTFPSQTKSFNAFPGTNLVRHVHACTSVPCFAIGGITLENLSQVVDAGASRVAVQSAITRAGDPLRVAERFREQLLQVSRQRHPSA